MTRPPAHSLLRCVLSRRRPDASCERPHLAGIVPALVLAAFVGACQADMVNPQVTPPDSSVAFADGYTPGCLSGFKDADRVGYETSYIKDVARYGSDLEYRAGWDRGHDACYLEEQLHSKLRGEGADFL